MSEHTCLSVVWVRVLAFTHVLRALSSVLFVTFVVLTPLERRKYKIGINIYIYTYIAMIFAV